MEKSFVKLEHEYKHEFRDKLNKAESTDEVGGFFKEIILNMLNDIDDSFERKHYEFIRFTPNNNEPYKFLDPIYEETPLAELLEHSDLEAIISRFAESAKHHHKQLKK